jgi:hypothetical protein
MVNPESKAYLRGLEQEFDESTNSIRIELNRFERAGIIQAHKEGNKKVYQVNTHFPMFKELQKIAFKHYGIDKIVEHIVQKLGDIERVYLTGDLAKGLNSPIVDIVIIGKLVDTTYLSTLVQKAEKLINRKIRYLVFTTNESIKLTEPSLLIYGEKE